MITGSTSGIGLNLAKELHAYGATVVIAARNEKKAQGVINDLRAANPGSKGEFVFGQCDTSDLDSVKAFASWVSTKFAHIDYLVNNAGIMYASSPGSPLLNLDEPIMSKQGYDLSFVTNYMGHFLLTHLLLPLVKDKVLNVASAFHIQADGTTLCPKINPTTGKKNALPDAANGEIKGYKHRAIAYGASKLAQIWHTKELQRRIASSKMPYADQVKSVALCPGWVDTGFLPSGLVGDAIRACSFTGKAANVTPMSILFDKSLAGGDFRSNYVLPFRQSAWFNTLFAVLDKLDIRGPGTVMYGTLLLFMQGYSYGYRSWEPSIEAQQQDKAAELFEWTLAELTTKGYIKA